VDVAAKQLDSLVRVMLPSLHTSPLRTRVNG